jgi:two-component system alkaline phosphatase synthesis response regulator PhoP
MTATTYGVRILLVDDDTAVLAQLGDRLKRAGFDVQMARAGQEALAGLGPFSPDVVLLDLMGPGMDGEATAKRILREPAKTELSPPSRHAAWSDS